jgi:uncharacterized membrane protein
MQEVSEKTVHRIFFWSVLLKGFDSVIEIIGGVLFLFTGAITGIIAHYTENELLEDPTDFIARHIHDYLPHLSGHSQIFIAIYLLSHGLIKIFLVVNLLRRRAWAYPFTIWVLAIFIVYQIYRLFAHGFSIILILLTVFDILLIYLTWHEYRLLKKHLVIEQ